MLRRIVGLPVRVASRQGSRMGLRSLMTDITSKEQYKELCKAPGQHLTVDYYTASWCSPCSEVAPAVEKLSAEMENRVHWLRIDIDTMSELAESNKVASVPLFSFMKEGKVVERITGANADALRECVERLAPPPE